MTGEKNLRRFRTIPESVASFFGQTDAKSPSQMNQDEQSADDIPAPKGKGYMINVGSYKNGIGYGKWTHIDGFSESVVRYIQAVEETSKHRFTLGNSG